MRLCAGLLSMIISAMLFTPAAADVLPFRYTYRETDALLEIGKGDIASAFIAVPNDYIIVQGQDTAALMPANEPLTDTDGAKVEDDTLLFICTNESRTHAFSVQWVGDDLDAAIRNTVDDPYQTPTDFDANGIPGKLMVRGPSDTAQAAFADKDVPGNDEDDDAEQELLAFFKLSDGAAYLLYEVISGDVQDSSILNNLFPVCFDDDQGYRIVTTEQEIEEYLQAIALTGKTGICTGKNVRVRTEPFMESRGIGRLGVGDQVTILEIRGVWCKVSCAYGEGWIKTAYVTTSPASPGE